MKTRKPGSIPDGRIGCFDSAGRLRGHCGPQMTAAGVARLTKEFGAVLGKKDGRPAWITPGRRGKS